MNIRSARESTERSRRARVALVSMSALAVAGVIIGSLTAPRPAVAGGVAGGPRAFAYGSAEHRAAMTEVARDVADRGLLAWGEQGLSRDTLADLRSLAETLLRAQFLSDFESHERALTERGLAWGEGAERTAARVREGAYRDDADPSWGNGTARDRLARVWSEPGRRRAEFLWVDAERATFGSWYAFNPGPVFFQLTLASTEEHMRLMSRAGHGQAPTAWVEVPCTFADGSEFAVRLTFIFDDQRGRWLPAHIATLGEGVRRPFLLF
ncbi:MAG: hypothetical protein HRU70_09785 [Phycisphaeraceae bacterium]|nr:MAG: hypothetical protein HRU70_09785 [Phycisphaeraceae bacterium]